MIQKLRAWANAGRKPDVEKWLSSRWLRAALWAIAGLLCLAKFYSLIADFPNYSPWMIDQAKFTDEGWWSSAAVAHALTGHWYVAGDYNPAVALPVWPILLSTVLHFAGVSIEAARALNVVLSIATLGTAFLLVRRYAGRDSGPALLAVVLLAASPFAFSFNRLAILETPVLFEFCLLLLVASYASLKCTWPLAAMAALVTAMLLTKTTAVMLIPAVFWLAWSAMERRWAGFWRAAVAAAVAPLALVKGYAALVAALGYGADYKYFFDVNAMPELDWRQTAATIGLLFQNCLWVDRVLYPVGLAILAVTVAWKRGLWRNPLFAASWLAIGGQAAFIFLRQDDAAPRYFLAMLPPLVWIVVLAFGELLRSARWTAALLLVAMAVSFGMNVWTIGHIVTHYDYDMRDAARSIQKIVRSHPEQKPLLLGVSAPQISLMTGIPSINDFYGTEDLGQKVARYQPGWYLEWNNFAPDDKSVLARYRLEAVGSYEAFDDDERTTLTLYKMTPAVSGGTPLSR